MREGSELQQPPTSESLSSQPNPLSSSSPFRCTFYCPATTVGSRAELPVKRDPLNPSYPLPAYDVRCPSPPPFLRSSLDVSDIEGAKPRRSAQAQHETRSTQPQRAAASASPAATTSASRCPFCCTLCSPPCSPWSTVSCPPPILPHQPHPHRFQHSPTVLSVPPLPFSDLYSAAVCNQPSAAFRFAINRPFHLPSHQSPIGGDTQSRTQKQPRPQRQPQLRPRARVRLRDVQSRVDCWRESAGEAGREAGGWQRTEWRRLSTEDRQLVHSLA